MSACNDCGGSADHPAGPCENPIHAPKPLFYESIVFVAGHTGWHIGRAWNPPDPFTDADQPLPPDNTCNHCGAVPGRWQR